MWPIAIDISEHMMTIISCDYMWHHLHSRETSCKQESKLYGAFNDGPNSLQGYYLNNLFLLILRRRYQLFGSLEFDVAIPIYC
jgi:hypothetical protein